ncbi:MAG: hypothetical protein ACXVPQ_10505 [Bacteroidia bacterium]
MKTTRFITLALAAILLCSCRQNLFMQRKYTKGTYFDPVKEINEPVTGRSVTENHF